MGAEFGLSLAIDGQERIVIAGSSNSPTSEDMAVWRFLPDGTLDPSFNGQGWAVHDNAAGGQGDDRAWAVAISPAGRIVIAGLSEGPTDRDMAVWRYLDDGTLDPSFNGKGWLTRHDAAGGGGDDSGHGVAIDSVGRIVVAGWSDAPSGEADMVVWRFE